MKITERAKSFLEETMNEHGLSTVRVVFAGMGWGAPKLGLALDEPAETDKQEKINGINVAFEESVIEHVSDLTLDYQESESGAGLVMVGSGQDCC